MTKYYGFDISYSTIKDIRQCAFEARCYDYEQEALELERCADDLERNGEGFYNGQTYLLRETTAGPEVISEADLDAEERK